MGNLLARATERHGRTAGLLAICKRRDKRKSDISPARKTGAESARKNVPAKWQELHVTSPNVHQR
jgi:hypothetical protein